MRRTFRCVAAGDALVGGVTLMLTAMASSLEEPVVEVHAHARV